MATTEVLNYAGGQWTRPSAGDPLRVRNPATGREIATVPCSTGSDVDRVVQAAHAAYQGWRRTPPTDRIQPLFRLKAVLEEQFEDIARTITEECGKTIVESRAELRRGIENVEVATGIPSLMMGSNLEDIAAGVDELMIRQPVGVVAAITPFNFPGMIQLWFLPYAVACGNVFIAKPSERVPLTMQKIMGAIEKAGFPPGVVSLVNGGKEAVDGLLDHPLVRAISFVGSTPVARYVYARAAERGKRAQCQGGAKNIVVVLPDADMEMTTRIVADAAFGCAGQRCLAASMAIAVGEAERPFTERMAETAASRRVGFGLDESTEMGPVITAESRQRIEGLIASGEREGARVLVDGRQPRIPGYEDGYFVKPTLVVDVPPASEIARTEVFGPVLGMMRVPSFEEAIELINRASYGNMACLFTSSGPAARKFRYEVLAGNIGINVGVAAPMAFFPFSGWKESFFGDLHAQGRDAIDFYTEKKIVVERWPKEWTRVF
jgi:malonate-semialdehyde dehydrogenase (acetylating) / methylmalonate-semialdehyde dehydrogenase